MQFNLPLTRQRKSSIAANDGQVEDDGILCHGFSGCRKFWTRRVACYSALGRHLYFKILTGEGMADFMTTDHGAITSLMLLPLAMTPNRWLMQTSNLHRNITDGAHTLIQNWKIKVEEGILIFLKINLMSRSYISSRMHLRSSMFKLNITVTLKCTINLSVSFQIAKMRASK